MSLKLQTHGTIDSLNREEERKKVEKECTARINSLREEIAKKMNELGELNKISEEERAVEKKTAKITLKDKAASLMTDRTMDMLVGIVGTFVIIITTQSILQLFQTMLFQDAGGDE